MKININIYNSNGSTQRTIIEISKKDPVSVLKNEVLNKFKIPVSNQMMVYFGKQLVDRVTLLDYKILEGGTVNLYVRDQSIQQDSNKVTDSNESKKITDDAEKETKDDLIEASSKFYKCGDFVDIFLVEQGWCEGIIVEILVKKANKDSEIQENKLIFKIKSADHITPGFEENAKFKDIRPRSYYIYKKKELHPGMVVLANYNLEETEARGFWFNFKIEKIVPKNIIGTVLIGSDKTPLENCSIVFLNEIMRIEQPDLLKNRNDNEIEYINRKYPFYCTKCRDDKRKKCSNCGCKICKGKENWDKILLCDECDSEYHIFCLDPPLKVIPEDDWYCHECKVDGSEIVRKGEFKLTKTQANMTNKKSTSTKDWGRGMACAGRSKICTLVSKHHFGPIPGVEVGTCWLYRVQVSEAGIHRPLVSGIHGSETKGAFSLVISSGYEDDYDRGYDFLYTGSGGRDLSGNKRVSKQSSDQVLTHCNKALAMNCNAPFNKEGAKSKDWKKGKPVRVVRNYKASSHSKFAPKAGNRYDGIYKVVKYFPEKGSSGFIVWKFLLKRDDPTPPPWAKGGQEFEMIYPPLHKELEAQKENNNPNGSMKRQTSAKRKNSNTVLDSFITKKQKLSGYTLPREIDKLIKKDYTNKNKWTECSVALKEGKSEYLAKVQEIFYCICCADLAFKPVTLDCKHIFCKACLKRAFNNKLFSCPCCRFPLGEDNELKVNSNSDEALRLLFPGYGPG